MKAVRMDGFGGPEVLRIGEVETPEPADREVLVRIRAAALNRADLLQRRGKYPPPPGAPDILGLEAAGEVVSAGSASGRWKEGDRVCFLLAGGGYAQYAAVHEDMLMPVPERLSLEQAAAVPEAFLTAYLNLFWLGGLRSGDRVLIHAGASGVGTAAIQLAAKAGAAPYVTAGSAEKLSLCRRLGAVSGWNYRDGAFADWLLRETDGHGADVLLDFVGAPYLAENLKSMAQGGRLIVIGTMGGAVADGFNLSLLLAKKLHLMGTTLRGQPQSEKIRLTREFVAYAWRDLESGAIFPVVDSVFDWRDVADAHRHMEANRNMGKIVLRVE